MNRGQHTLSRKRQSESFEFKTFCHLILQELGERPLIKFSTEDFRSDKSHLQ